MTRALLLVARWIGLAHDRWRAGVARRRTLSALVDAPQEDLHRLREENDLLRAPLRRLAPLGKPRYRPHERLRILWHRARYGLSVRATARAFVLATQTVLNGTRAVERGNDRLVRVRRSANALADLAGDLVHLLRREWPRWGGTRRVASVLARLGVAASRSSVQRLLRRPPPRPARQGPRSHHGRGPLRARRPGQVWIVDFTRVGGMFRSVRVGAAIDAFSRRVLAIGVVPREPTAAFAIRLLGQAVGVAGGPGCMVTDRGRQFTSRAFSRALQRRGIRQRFGAVESRGPSHCWRDSGEA